MCGGSTIQDVLTWPTDMFKTKTSDMQPLPSSPAKDDAAVQAAAERERELARRRKGKESTILTGSTLGKTADGQKTLLGQ